MKDSGTITVVALTANIAAEVNKPGSASLGVLFYDAQAAKLKMMKSDGTVVTLN